MRVPALCLLLLGLALACNDERPLELDALQQVDTAPTNDGEEVGETPTTPDTVSPPDEGGWKGPDGTCEVWVPESDPGTAFCEGINGTVFDGEQCVLVSGCDCEPECDRYFAPWGMACETACSNAGYCNDQVLVGAGLNTGQPVRAGMSCDELVFCAGEGGELINEAFGEAFGGAEPVCVLGGRCSGYRCELRHVTLTEAQERALCAVSIAQHPEAIAGGMTCALWGP